MANTPISINFRGLMVMCISPKWPDFGEIGLLREAPGHALTFEVIQTDGQQKQSICKYGEEFFPSIIRFDFPNHPDRGIKYAVVPLEPHFDRVNNGGSIKDFNWVIDLEGQDFHAGPLRPINLQAFVSFVQMNDGEFSTKCKSITRAMKIDRTGSSLYGKVAMVVKAKIELAEGTQAMLWCGSDRYNLTAGDNRRYDIYVDRSCPVIQGENEQSHFQLYYNAVGTTLGLNQKFDLALDQSGMYQGQECLIDPDDPIEFLAALDVRCTLPRLGLTPRLTPEQ